MLVARYASGYGSYVTAWKRLRRWSEEGVWDRVLAAIRDSAYSAKKLSLNTVSVDSSLIDSKKVDSSQSITVIRREKVSRFMSR